MQRSLFLKASCFWRTAWCTWKISTFKSFDFIAIVKTTRRPVNVRSSHQRWSIKRVFLEILQNWHENNCANVPFFNKVAGLRPTTLLIKRLWQRCFPENLAKFLRTPFLTEHLRWLLLMVLSTPLTSAITLVVIYWNFNFALKKLHCTVIHKSKMSSFCSFCFYKLSWSIMN